MNYVFEPIKFTTGNDFIRLSRIFKSKRKKYITLNSFADKAKQILNIGKQWERQHNI